MKVKSSIYLIVLFLFLQTNSFSENVSIEKARFVAENFLSEKMHSQDRNLQFGEEYIVTEKGVIAYYVFNVNDGFIIISADDAVFPVLGYSFVNNYSGSNFPPAFEAFMQHSKEQILFAREKKIVAPNSVKRAWKKYTEETFVPDMDILSVEPLIQTNWSQGCYYNTLFPIDTTAPCGHLWTGCVATAMGQIMKYYNFPKSGTGSHGYDSPYDSVWADFENTIYDWAGMKNHLINENNPVAELLYHAAISINSQFYSYGTGAYDFHVPDALVNYFNYKSDVQFYWRDDYQGDWKAMLRTELDSGRPLLYGGAASETNAGHTLVCDGYQDTAFFHFNWGWNGFYNGYFYLDSLIAGGNHFDFQHDAVVGIKPDISGIVELYPAENLLATVDYNNVTLNWDHSTINSSLELIGYNIFRNDTLLTESVLSGLFYMDAGVSSGSHEYKVQSVFIGNGSGPFVSAEAYISGTSNHYTELIKVYPNPANEYIHIENSINDNNLNSVEIYELSGKKIYSQDVSDFAGKTKTIVLPKELKGIYLLRLNGVSFELTKKLLIN